MFPWVTPGPYVDEEFPARRTFTLRYHTHYSKTASILCVSLHQYQFRPNLMLASISSSLGTIYSSNFIDLSIYLLGICKYLLQIHTKQNSFSANCASIRILDYLSNTSNSLNVRRGLKRFVEFKWFKWLECLNFQLLINSNAVWKLEQH